MNNELYIELLKKVLIDYHRMGAVEFKQITTSNASWKRRMLAVLDRNFFRKLNYAVCEIVKSDPEDRINGKDRPVNADTMVGLKRLNNIEFCVKEIIKNNVQGDLIETGVWRGGSVIFMKALLKANNINNRVVWVADSFEGLPEPDSDKYKADKGDKHYLEKGLAVSLEAVKKNFEKYDLLDENVKFLKGWFKDTLPTAPIKSLALLRLDGDLYESTMDALVNLYPKVSKGGYIIVDDYGYVASCKQAVNDYRQKHNITDKITEIDWTGVYWRKEQ